MKQESEKSIKYASLIVLIVQNTFTAFVMRYSRTLPDKYLSSTAVVCSEILKLITSLIIHVILRVKENGIKNYSFKMLINETFGKESDCLKLMIPAGLYLIQNNLQYFTLSKLDVATFQITSQMKLITTAFFSVVILKRKIFGTQWLSIFLLAVGIAIVQFPADSGVSKVEDNVIVMDRILGLLSVFTTCIISGVAGVYFEKFVKVNNVSLWVRNIQLSFFSVIPGYLIGCLLMDGEVLREKGFFGGYCRWTVLAIMCQAFSGMIVAVVIKYADNILKGFANSISIIASCIISYFFFDLHLTVLFILGCVIVLFSTYLYGKPRETENDDTEYIKLDEEVNKV